MSVVGALLYGLANLLHPRMLWLMVWPMLVAVVFWGAVAAAFGMRLAAALSALFQRWLEPAAGFVRLDFGDVTVIAAYVVLFLLAVPLVYLTALFILGGFGMPKMVEHVAQRSFPALERKRGGGAAGDRDPAAAAGADPDGGAGRADRADRLECRRSVPCGVELATGVDGVV